MLCFYSHYLPGGKFAVKQKRKKREFNDLMIPILFVIGILPFITRLIVYESGLSKYSWFSDNDITTDFFSYYKSYSFLVVAIVCTVILFFSFLLYKSSWKGMRAYIPLGAYSITSILSTIFSVDTHTSFVGGVGRFENLFVLLGYIILSIYTYQMVKRNEDFQVIIKVFIISITIMSIIGFSQMIGQDLLRFELIQKLIIPSDYWSDYLGAIKSHLSTNAVSLTLFNPNYASVYIAMVIPFFIALLITTKERGKKVLYLVIISLMLILLYMTYSRTGLVSLFVSLLVLGYFYRNYLKNIWKQLLLASLLFLCILTTLDSFANFTFLSRIVSTFHSFKKNQFNYNLEDILTKQDSIYIRYKGEDLYVSFNNNTNEENDLHFSNEVGDDISYLYDSDSNILDLKPFDILRFKVENLNDVTYITSKINNRIWRFSYNKETGYQYYNDLGKYDTLKPIESFGFDDYQNIASGRGYIWSRSIPLLKENLFLGSGPDTYPLIYPQWDYVGKANNCKTPYTIIEKPHNMYLSIALQTGMVSLIAILIFLFMYIIKSICLYRKCKWDNYVEGIGLGCLVACISYMVSGLFNDSAIQTSPIFWVLLGLGMAANHKLEKSLDT